MSDVDVAYIESSENYGTSNSLYAPIPPLLDYNQPQAVGLVKRLKDAKFYPNGASSIQYGPGDTIRFNINTNDFWDPYSARIRLTVKVPAETFNNPATDVAWDGTVLSKCKSMCSKCVQLDSSALSFFSNYKFMDQGKDLERIDEADTIGCGVKDMTYGRTVRTTKDHEGLGGQLGSNFNNQTTVRIGMTTISSVGTEDELIKLRNFQKANVGATPVIARNNTPLGKDADLSITGDANKQTTLKSLFYDPTRQYNYNGATNRTGSTAGANASWPDIAAQREYQQKPLPVLHMLYDCPNLGFDTIYGDGWTDTIGSTIYSIGSGSIEAGASGYPGITNTNLTNNIYPSDASSDTGRCDVYGFSTPFPPNFGTSTFEPIFSHEPQRVIKNGVPSAARVDEYTFHIPLFSGLFGCLMQPNNYKLIPMVAFKGLIFEFVLSQHALFTSFSSTDSSNRRYVVTGIELNVQLAEFLDLNVIRATNDSMLKGFTMTTQSYDFCTKVAVSANNIPPEIQVNKGHDSLRNLYIINLDNAYLTNTMFRKQYRLSLNITKLQAKIGTDYFPPQPIEGHAGNNYGRRNCYEFYLNLLRSFNKLNSLDELAINPHNFCINWRELFIANLIGKVKTNLRPAFDADDGKGAYKPDSATIAALATGPRTFQSYDAFAANGMQLGYFYENRIVGKAMYGIPMDFINYSNDTLSGIRTIDARPISILWECDNVNSAGNLANNTVNTEMGYGYAGNSTTYVFAEYDLILTFSKGEVKPVGRS